MAKITDAGYTSVGSIGIGTGGGGGSGQAFPNTGYYPGTSTATWTSTTTIYPGTVKLTDNDITIDGASLKDRLDKFDREIKTIQERLAIMVADPRIEEEFEELKRLGAEYRKLEAEILERLETWNVLKKP